LHQDYGIVQASGAVTVSSPNSLAVTVAGINQYAIAAPLPRAIPHD